MKQKLLTITKSRKFVLSLLLISSFFGKLNAAYFWQVASISSFTGSATYVQNATANPLVLSIQQCAGGISQPHNSTVYNQSLYVNSVNSTVGGTLVTTNVISTPWIFNPTYSYTPSTATPGTYYYYYMLTSPSMTTCGFTGTLTSQIATVVVTPTAPASSLNFDGTSDYVEVSSATGLPLGNNPRTLEAWVKTTNTAASTVIFNYGTPTNNNRCGMLVEGGTGRLYFVGEFNDLQGTPTATVADGNWHHVAVVYTGGATGTLSLYVDGKFNTSAVKNLNTTGSNLRIGQRAFPQTGEFFNGSIDEVRIWNVARTQCQLNTYMNCEIPTTSTGLVANYHFNQGIAAAPNATVTTLVDASGSNNNGTLNSFALNGTTSNWVAPGPFANGFATPLAAPAVSVTANPALSVCSGNTVSLSGAGANTYAWTGGITDGTAFTPTALINNYTVTGTNTITTCTNSAVASVSVSACSGTVASALNFNNASVPDNVALPTAIATSSLIGGNKITVEAWVRPTSLANLGCVIGNYATPNPNMQFLLRRDNNFYTFWVGNSATNSWTGVFSTAGTATLNTWHHVAGVYNGTVLSIYINGVLSSTATANYTFAPTTNSLLIGGNNISENFNGDIDEVRIWNTARTQCDINTYKNCEIPTNATGLVANYHFNQGFAAAANPTVTTLTDATSNAFNGTLNTFALNGATSNWVAPSGVANGFTTALAAPSISVAANPALGVCSGSSLSLTGSGVNTYTWTGGITNGTAFTPTASANYTVNGTNSITTCTATAVSNVTVNAIPTVSVNSGAICSGNSFTMAPTGAATYSYSSGSAVVTPSATAAYTVTGASAAGCTATAVSNVTVNALPAVNATSSTSLICVGQSATLTATGATTYSWSTGGATATEVITPTVTTSYTVTGVDANSCVNSAVVTQSVSACTGVNELGNAFNAVRLYPNPTSSDITLELPENANVVIYNSLGQVIFNQNLTYGNNVINLDALAKGIYVVQISNAANKANYRVVKH